MLGGSKLTAAQPGHVLELLTPMIVAASLALGPSGIAVDVAVAQRWPRIAIW
jgi:hypothetical protein